MLARVLYRGFSPYFFARKALYNLRNFSDHRRRKGYHGNTDREILSKLEREGWSDVGALQIAGKADVISYCRELADRVYPSNDPPTQHGGKDFWTLIVNRSNIGEHAPILRFGSQAALKDLASTYLGEEAVLSEITLMKSFPTGRASKHSQLWHLDGDDSGLLLFYVYCSDVDSSAGPFMVMPKPVGPRHLLPRFLRKHGYSDDDVGSENAVQIVGPVGTTFACDTATTYHCGSRCDRKTRLALSVRYTTRSGLYPVSPLA